MLKCERILIEKYLGKAFVSIKSALELIGDGNDLVSKEDAKKLSDISDYLIGVLATVELKNRRNNN